MFIKRFTIPLLNQPTSPGVIMAMIINNNNNTIIVAQSHNGQIKLWCVKYLQSGVSTAPDADPLPRRGTWDSAPLVFCPAIAQERKKMVRLLWENFTCRIQ